MKILAEAKSDFDVNDAIEKIVYADNSVYDVAEGENIATEGENITTMDIFLELADRYKGVTFILLNDEDRIVGWRQ